jgi:MFS family permease
VNHIITNFVTLAMQGIGGGGIISLLMVLVADITPIDKRGPFFFLKKKKEKSI